MPDTLTVHPVPGGPNVRDPETLRHLPPEGATVPRTTYWLRRIACGDVTETPPATGRGRQTPTNRE